MADEEAADVPPEPVPRVTEEELEARKGVFDQIFAGYEALEVKQKSMAERREKEAPPPPPEDGDAVEEPPETTPNIALAYSELSFSIVDRFVNLVKEKCGPMYPGQGVFLDFGSGCGKNCLAAALLHPFQKVVGIEALQSLNDIEAAVQAKYAEAELPEGLVKPEISFVKGDFVSEFDTLLETIAPEATFVVATATTFGDPEMQAVAKLAQKMPQGASLFTVTQKLEDALVVDVNRAPRQRRFLATKKALAQRGVEPTGIEIELEPAENDLNGWRLMHSEPLELEWGTTTCYLYKKYCYPFCDVGDVCMATGLPEADQTVMPAYYVGPTAVRYMDDLSEKEVEVSKIAPFCEESRKKAVNLYQQMKLETLKQLAASKSAEEVADALALIRTDNEAFAQDGKVEATDIARLLEALSEGYGVPPGEKVAQVLGSHWTDACAELDTEGTGAWGGALQEEQLQTVWGKVKGKIAGMVESKLMELKGERVGLDERKPGQTPRKHKAVEGLGLVQLGSQLHRIRDQPQEHNASALVPLLEVEQDVSGAAQLAFLEDGRTVLGLVPNGTLLMYHLESTAPLHLRLPQGDGAEWLGLCSPGGREVFLVGRASRSSDFGIWRTYLPAWL
ncbi:unnamed protein product [Effrenium voratum]|uniref:Histone-lysine N-methyltransferase, H3 lysine-79 specific n=1 Tax=Effrenium voratum TaxID=2562239 RepID=A0AA36HNW2_9DINO|nr:unnamed protein product [Effrenium voratum]